jgi:SAM-dependent methyltransferase
LRSDFQDTERADAYRAFGRSDDGIAKHDLIADAVLRRLAGTRDLDIVEIGTGTGWLAARMRPHARRIVGIDGSAPLLAAARRTVPGIDFVEADLQGALPLPDRSFDVALACLVLHDLRPVARATAELARVLRPGGRLLVVDLNAYYAHPVGSWTRTWRERLTRAPRGLRVASYGDWLRREDRAFAWGDGHASWFTPLPELVNAVVGAGFAVQWLEDLVPPDSPDGRGLAGRMHRFPVYVLLDATRSTDAGPAGGSAAGS